jgi:hypothetical protein
MAHLPRSIRRQRSEQKGKSSSVALTSFLQVGQWSDLILGLAALGIGISLVLLDTIFAVLRLFNQVRQVLYFD